MHKQSFDWSMGDKSSLSPSDSIGIKSSNSDNDNHHGADSDSDCHNYSTRDNHNSSIEMATRKLNRRPSILGDSEVDKLYHHFLRLDANGNGQVESAEFLMTPEAQQNPLSSRLLSLFDRDNSGYIDFQEFTNGLAVFSSKASKDRKLKFAFEIYDLDGDGYITNGELFTVLKVMTGSHLSDNQLQQVVDKSIRDADKDKDGKISFEEFKKVINVKNSAFLELWTIKGL